MITVTKTGQKSTSLLKDRKFVELVRDWMLHFMKTYYDSRDGLSNEPEHCENLPDGQLFDQASIEVSPESCVM